MDLKIMTRDCSDENNKQGTVWKIEIGFETFGISLSGLILTKDHKFLVKNK